jgi:hypothetical protein
MPAADMKGGGCNRSQQTGFAGIVGKRPRAAACPDFGFSISPQSGFELSACRILS